MNESLVIQGSSTGAVIQRVRILIDETRYVVSQPSDTVVQLVTAKKGLLRSSSTLCTIRAVAEPQRLIVTITGQLDSDDLEPLRAAVLGRSSEQMLDTPVDSFRPSTQSVIGGFVAPTDWFVTGGPATSAQSTAAVVPGAAMPELLHQSPGQVDRTVIRPSGGSPGRANRHAPARLRIGAGTPRQVPTFALIGRSPQRRDSDPVGAELIDIADSALSKTHLAIGTDGVSVWVVDRNSSNGTQVIELGQTRTLPSETRVIVQPGTHIVVGDTTLLIEDAT